MTQPSITSSDSFRARLLRSERWRAGLVAGVWVVLMITYLARRVLGGVVMGVDVIFFTAIGVLAVGILFEGLLLLDIRRRARLGITGASWRWVISAAVELAVPMTLLALMQEYSPRGAYAALSGPSLLVMPIIIMLSILRLRPRAALWTGVAAGAAHWLLVAVALGRAEIERGHWPPLFTYGALLALTGVVAAAIAKQARAYVQEAVEETVAAERAERALMSVEHDLSVARDIQRGLMPAGPPTMAGFDIAGMARPAQQTGGDYYDWQQMADGRLVVALADVTGHGIGPALVMAVCRAYARASAPMTLDPAGILAHINKLIYDDLQQTGRFITMAIAIVSPDGGVQLVSAGHGPTLLYRGRTREVEWFGGDGIPLGIDVDEGYGAARLLRLERDDVLMMLTDGFMEWSRRSDKQQFGLERLRNTLKSAAGGPAKSILDRLDAAVAAFAEGAPQTDDTTAVVIKRTG